MILKSIAIVLLITTPPSLQQTQECRTNGGPKPNAKCIFPFKYKGKTYNGCPPDLDDKTKTWCSTKVDGQGNHMTGRNEYGFCDDACPKEGGTCTTVGGPRPNVPCIFPFEYEGVSYNYCPVDPEDPTKRWCSTKVDASEKHVSGAGEYGHCGPDCPVQEPTNQPTNQPVNQPGNLAVQKSCPKDEVCRPFIQCASQISPAEARTKLCSFEKGSTGVCCKEITKLEGTNEIVHPPPQIGIRSIGIVSNAELLRAVDIGESFLTNVTKKRTESKTVKSKKSPEFQHAIFQEASPGVIERGKICLIAMEAARTLAKDSGLEESIGNSIDFAGLDINNSLLKKMCPKPPKCNFASKYRMLDGTCNNKVNPRYGQVFTPVQRVLPNAYADGLMAPRVSHNGRPLPSPRQITNIAIQQNTVEETRFTAMLVGFGQIVDHDLDHIPISRSDADEFIECCTEDGQFPETLVDPTLCLPIRVPENDARIAPRTCINFVRSVCSLRLDCLPGPIEQVNQVTHWMDNSQVYGSTEQVHKTIRLFKDGLMRTEPCENGLECLPFAVVENCFGKSPKCSLAGDLRVNVTPTLGVMHMLLLREHNRIARALKAMNPRWNDEKLFQETRRILNAEFQHIVYNELLPVLLGTDFMKNFNLIPLTKGYSDGYRDDFDPRTTNEFAAAAYRIGHTLITPFLKMFKNLKLSGSLSLKDVFNNAEVMREGNNFDEIVAGLTMQPSEALDTNFANDVANDLFDDDARGMDLLAINIQRGRDHGLPGYVEYRRACQAGPSESFEDLDSNMTPESVALLRKAYVHVEDIDLFMGMTHEKPCKEGDFIGCTFKSLIGDVFARARLGDRFFYDMPNQPGSFNEAQLSQIRRVSLARLICDNTKITSITPLTFRLPHPETNPVTPCKSALFLTGILTVDLSVFKG